MCLKIKLSKFYPLTPLHPQSPNKQGKVEKQDRIEIVWLRLVGLEHWVQPHNMVGRAMFVVMRCKLVVWTGVMVWDGEEVGLGQHGGAEG